MPNPPSPDLLALLGVLRRPAASGDVLPHLQPGVPRPAALSGLDTIDINYIRVLGSDPAGDVYYAIPGTPFSPGVSKRCLRILPKRVRRLLGLGQRDAARRRRQTVVLELRISADGTAASSYFDVSQISYGQAVQFTSSISPPGTTVSGIVPDGVAEVVIQAQSGPVQTVATVGNFYVAQFPVALPPDQLLIIWKAADGTEIHFNRMLDSSSSPTITPAMR